MMLSPYISPVRIGPAMSAPPPARPFYLLTENCFDGSYLIADWLHRFNGSPNFRGILVRDTQEQGKLAEKVSFHRQFQEAATMPPEKVAELYGLYSNTSGYAVMSGLLEASIRLFGIPQYPESPESDDGRPLPIRWIGHDVNSPEMQSWLEGIVAREPKPTFFIYLDRILKPWWIEQTSGRIINAHPAVLPHARGMWAIEQVAGEMDPQKLRRCAGATVHFVNAGVDTGAIIQAAGLDPFQSQTLPELSARSLRLATRLLCRTARRMMSDTDEEVRGVDVDPKTLGRNYRSKDFDAAAAENAIRCFERMRSQEIYQNVSQRG